MIKSAPHKTLKSIASGKLTFDERDGVHRAAPSPARTFHVAILCENRFNLKAIFKAILATLQRISDYSL